MATKKKPIVQGGVDNYLGNEPQVQAPRRWQSGPNKPPTELAYITEAEKDLILKTDLHGSLRKGPNIGPSGIMSLDSFGDTGGGGASGGDTEAGGGAMEGRGFSGQGPGESGRDFDRRKANERAVLQIAERKQAGNLGYNERGNGISGLLGGIGRGVLGFFGGVPGKIMSGIMGARNLAKRTGAKIGEEVDEFSQYPTFDRYLNRNTDKYKDKPYRGQGQGYDFSDKGNNLGLQTNRLNEPYVDEGRIGEYWRNPPLTNNLGTNNQFVEEEEQDFNMPLPMGSAEGGRIGYERGRVVNPGGYNGADNTWQGFLASQGEWQIRPGDNDWKTVYHRWLDSKKADGGIARLL